MLFILCHSIVSLALLKCANLNSGNENQNGMPTEVFFKKVNKHSEIWVEKLPILGVTVLKNRSRNSKWKEKKKKKTRIKTNILSEPVTVGFIVKNKNKNKWPSNIKHLKAVFFGGVRGGILSINVLYSQHWNRHAV